MKLNIINNIRVLTPNDGMWLYNEEHKVISEEVHLGVKADETKWYDITEAEKTRLEALWDSDISDSDLKAQAYDILMGNNINE